jgi:hypothetical protein
LLLEAGTRDDKNDDVPERGRAYPKGDKRGQALEQHQATDFTNSSLHIALASIAIAAMDYSAHDADHPGGTDPWASSPQHSRNTSFAQPPSSDVPSSPLPPQASPYGQGSENYGYIDDHGSQNRPNTASENGDNGQRPQSSGQPGLQSPQPQQQQAPAQGQQGNQKHDHANRYHGQRQQQRQQQPQYKLQAKVTGLERTGRKDPILKFDVYVCLALSSHPPVTMQMRQFLWLGIYLLT